MNFPNINFLAHDCCLGINSTDSKIILREDEFPRYPNIHIEINLNDFVCGFKLDCKKTGRLTPYIDASKKRVLCAADAIIILKSSNYDFDKTLHLIIIELKSNEFKLNDIWDKIYISKIFSEFIIYNHCNLHDIKSKDVNIVCSYNLFTTKPIAKTRPSNCINIDGKHGTIKRFYINPFNPVKNIHVNTLLR